MIRLPYVLLAVSLGAGVAQAQEKIDRTLDVSPDGVVEIGNVSGSVEVTGWDRKEVHVTGTLGEGTEKLEFTTSNGRTVVEVKIPKHARNVEGSHLKINVPLKSSLEVSVVSAEIDVKHVNGTLDLESVSGGVTVDGDPVTVRAESVSGGIEIHASSEEIEAETVSGSVEIDGVKRRARVSSVSGGIDVTGANLREANFESVSGSIRFNGGLEKDGRLEVSSHSGSVLLRLPASVSADFDVSTFSGDIKNELGPDARRTSRYTPGKELSFTTGSGSARVTVESFSGSIRLLEK